MAIKIIKPGRKRIPIYSAKCSHCECEFEFNKKDFIQFFAEDNCGFIKCPHCANVVTFIPKPKRYEII